MGCDIHVYTEAQYDGKWLCRDYFQLNRYYGKYPDQTKYEVVPIYSNRDYELFATLANVRNYDDIPYISTPRGLPDDISDTIKEEAERWGRDGHSHSYLTAKELFDWEETHKGITIGGLVAPKIAKLLDEEHIIPTSWCLLTSDESYVHRTWETENWGLKALVEKVKERMCEEFWIWDFLPEAEKEEKIKEKAEDFRLVFWFDS